MDRTIFRWLDDFMASHVVRFEVESISISDNQIVKQQCQINRSRQRRDEVMMNSGLDRMDMGVQQEIFFITQSGAPFRNVERSRFARDLRDALARRQLRKSRNRGGLASCNSQVLAICALRKAS